ncbi:hypothetical protein NA56DRAFT_128274 [Hyaloscypha hepaticicola]|uniref:Uncharacterized protein n=1 Tax=Hyaloscypha hepaticicola TaxID=2082293 RepID=A0A2J6Q5P1_9HELO|nr:hypothetical protein NA56DRAFT_128274 [Hyaloscypha hepaticicola]
MAQPCGKVCNRNSRYSIYMRSWPLICLADTLSIFSKVGYYRLKLGMSIRKCVQIVIDERFGTHEEVLVFARSSWLRWLFFILGPMPQAVRLASFLGTPWTQFFGFSYFLSWILVEILALISARTVMQNAATAAHVNFEFLDKIYEGLALLCYASLLSYLPTRFESLARRRYQFWESPVWFSADWIAAFLLSLLAIPLRIIRELIIRALLIFCRKNIVMSQNLLVAFPEGELGTLKVDDDAIFWLLCFVANLLLCLIGYRFLYDSSGTVNPGWTAVFG